MTRSSPDAASARRDQEELAASARRGQEELADVTSPAGGSGDSGADGGDGGAASATADRTFVPRRGPLPPPVYTSRLPSTTAEGRHTKQTCFVYVAALRESTTRAERAPLESLSLNTQLINMFLQTRILQTWSSRCPGCIATEALGPAAYHVSSRPMSVKSFRLYGA